MDKELTKKKIAFVVVSLESGGTENYLLRFLRYLNQYTDITVICKGNQLGILEEQYRKTGVNIITFKLGYLNIKNILLYGKLLNQDFDVICDFTGNFAGISMWLGKLNKIPKRIAFYRASTDHFKESFFKNIYNNFAKKLTNRYSTHILSNSQAAFDNFFPNVLNDSRFRIIKNGVDSSTFCTALAISDLRMKYKIPVASFVIGHIGRYAEAKNFPTFFKVAEKLVQLKEGTNKFFFVFCGRGTDTQVFKDELKKHNIEQYSIGLGQQNKVYEVLKCYDLFFFPSSTEGQPNALIEAMLLNIPFIASNIQPIIESTPKAAEEQLVHPFDIDGAVKKIIELSEMIKTNKDISMFQEWAVANYSSEKRFKEFEDIIFD